MQAVDGLKTSAYLLDTAKEHIEACISIDEAQARIQRYYEERSGRADMSRMGLRDRNSFTSNYLNPALKAELIERTIPDKPTSRLQKYRKASSYH